MDVRRGVCMREVRFGFRHVPVSLQVGRYYFSEVSDVALYQEGGVSLEHGGPCLEYFLECAGGDFIGDGAHIFGRSGGPAAEVC